MAYDAEFIDGFDKYGPTGYAPVIADFSGEWTSLTATNNAPAIVAALVGTGQAYRINASASPGSLNFISKTLPGNFARIVGGMTLASNLLGSIALNTAGAGVSFGDGATDQLSLMLNPSGQIEVRRGAVNGTLMATSVQTVTANAVHCLEWDVTIHSTTGIVKVWLDGVLTSLNLTGQNTRSTANNYANTFRPTVNGGASGNSLDCDHLYLWMFTASGGSETPALTNPIIETQFPTSDSAVAFTVGAGVLGQAYRVVTTTNAPGANRLSLRKYTPGVAATINSVSLVPAATSATVKAKAVIYADSSGAPGSLLSSGTEVVGCTSGSTLTLPLVTPQALTAGTQYWIGYITDTSVLVQMSDASSLGYGAANTYTSGAPGTAPAMTSAQSSWQMWGNCTGMTVNYAEVGLNPSLGDLSYVASSTVSAEDLFNFPTLSSTPNTIYTVATKARMARTDAGARTVNLEQKSGSTTSGGSLTGQTPAGSYGWLASYFDTDPATGVAWGASGVNSAKAGYKIAS